MPGALSIAVPGDGTYHVRCRYHPELDLVAKSWEEAESLSDQHDNEAHADDSLLDSGDDC